MADKQSGFLNQTQILMSGTQVYKASAGSGKTWQLVANMLAFILPQPENFDRVLAITFTNKAAGEMKDRLLRWLFALSQGNAEKPLHDYLIQQTGLSEADLKANATAALNHILHRYTRLSVSTIDSFFQRIVRAFARELNVSVNYNLELDRQKVMDAVIDQLLDRLGEDKALTGWLLEYMLDQWEEGKSWNIRMGISSFSRELYGDGFLKVQAASHGNKDQVRAMVDEAKRKLVAVVKNFEHRMDRLGEDGLLFLEDHEVGPDDYSYGKGSGVQLLRKILKTCKDYQVGARARNGIDNPASLIKKGDPNYPTLMDALEAGALECMAQAIALSDQEYPRYQAAVACLRHLYQLGILTDLAEILADYREDENMLLIDDTTSMITALTADTEVPFIYEKVGTRYKFLLLDEFQDTSNRQWANLLPLVKHALSEGNSVMVVGDVKQSIYRWRGGNLGLLGSEMKAQLEGLGPYHEQPLAQNFRSLPAIVKFNNAIFTHLGQVLPEASGITDLATFPEYATLLADVEQQAKNEQSNDGLVQMRWVPYANENGKLRREEVLQACLVHMVEAIQECLDAGHKLRDITLLVDTNYEGSMAAQYLGTFGDRYRVVSSEALMLENATNVRILLYALRWLHRGDDKISAAKLAMEYCDLHHPGAEETWAMSALHAKDWIAPWHPVALRQRYNAMRHLPLPELCEELVRILGLTGKSDAFLQQFLDKVLDFSASEAPVLGDFLKWWDTEGPKQALQAESGNAIRIITIHKSKGLEFPIVICPFLELKLEHKHAPTLWVSKDEPPFDALPAWPVRYQKPEKLTEFSDAMTRERCLMVTDQVNKLYVALTRAEMRLYVISPLGTNSLAQIAHSCCSALTSEENGLQATWDDQLQMLRFGNPIRAKGPQEPQQGKEPRKPPIQTGWYRSSPWQKRIAVRRQSHTLAEWQEPDMQTGNKALDEGRLVHELLSRITYADTVEKALQSLVLEGLAADAEKPALHQLAEILLSHNIASRWFSSEWRVITERELVLPDGHVLRPDRVVVKGNHAVVLDFKTGAQSETHKAQVKRYGQAMEEMGFAHVEAWLWYTRDADLVNVSL